MIFIDSDFAIAFLSQKKTPLNEKAKSLLKSLFEENPTIFLTIFNYAELMRGVYLASNVARSERIVGEFASRFKIIPFSNDAAVSYAKISADLQKEGTKIGDFDELIASVVVSQNGIFYTHNVKHYQKIPLIQLRDWGI